MTTAGIIDPAGSRKKASPSPYEVLFLESMTKEKWVAKSVRALEALSHRCRGLAYVARPTNAVLTSLPVSWMTWFSAKALSYVILVLPELKLVKLKDRALVNGVGKKKRSVIVKRIRRMSVTGNVRCLILKLQPTMIGTWLEGARARDGTADCTGRQRF